MSLAVARLALFAALLAGAPARAEPEADPVATHCGMVATRAEALANGAPPLAPAELQARARAILDEIATLEGQSVHGVRLRLPWVEDTRAEVDRGTTAGALEGLVRFSATRTSEACRLLAAPRDDAPGLRLDAARLHEILSRPEFRLRSRDEFFLFRLFERIRTWFRDVFATDDRVVRTVLSFRTMFLVAVCLLAGWLAIRMARHQIRSRVRRRGSAGAERPLVLDDPARYEHAAEVMLGRGDGREAIRLALLALLATLERARLAAPGRAATNREVADHIAARGGPEALARETRQAIDWYDRAWYGPGEVSVDGAREFLGRVGALCAQARLAGPRRSEAA